MVTFTISDFGRTLSSNGNGSDHAWGGNQMIMGGAVDGGKIKGTYPRLQLANNPLNLDQRGRLIPTTSVDELILTTTTPGEYMALDNFIFEKSEPEPLITFPNDIIIECGDSTDPSNCGFVIIKG